MTLDRNKKIGVFVAVVVAFAFIIFAGGFFGSDDSLLRSVNPLGSEGLGDGEELDIEGVIAERVVSGGGQEAKVGDRVFVYYVGNLENGTEFDRTRDGSPFSFILGSGHVIKGWDLGVEGMKVGEVRTLVLPPELAYGDSKVGQIPANSTLTFRVELVEIKTPEN